MKKKKYIKKSESGLKAEYKTALRYLKESDNYILIVFGLFILFFSLGFLIPFVASEETLEPILKIIEEWVKEVLNETDGLGFFGIFRFIFVNNISVAFLSIFLGFLFGLFPSFLLLSNGIFVGLITGLVVGKEGFVSIWRLVPHGFFEIPAVIISFAVGIRCGTFLFNKKPLASFKYHFNNAIRVFFFVVIPLLVIAAIIEACLIVFFR